MPILRLIFLGFLFNCALIAKADADFDFCADPSGQQQFDGLLKQNLHDNGIVKLVALREGLCGLVGRQKLPLTKAQKLWAEERQKILTDRTKKHLSRMTP